MFVTEMMRRIVDSDEVQRSPWIFFATAGANVVWLGAGEGWCAGDVP